MKNMFKHPLFLLLIGIGLALLFMGNDSGYDISNKGKFLYDGEPIGVKGKCPPKTLAKIEVIYKVNEEKAKEKLENIQTNVCTAIELIRASRPDVAKCLKDAQKSGRLCMEFVAEPKLVGGTLTDNFPLGSKDCTEDRININYPYLPACDSFDCLNDRMLYLTNVLLHEGVHTIQDKFRFDLNPTDSIESINAKMKKIKYEDEILAIDVTQKIWCRINDSLVKILSRDGMPVPQPLPGGMPGVILKKLNDLGTDSLRKAKATSMIVSIGLIKIANKRYRRFNAFVKKAACDFIDGTITLEEYRKKLKKAGVAGFFNVSDGLQDNFISTDSLPFLLTQTIGDSTLQLFHDLDFVSDFYLPSSDKFVMAGPSSFGSTILLGFTDLNGDGFFEPTSQQFLLEIDSSAQGLDFISLANGQLLIFDYDKRQMFELADTNNDGFPDQLLTSPLTATLPDAVVDWVPAFGDSTLLFGLTERRNGHYSIYPIETHFILEDQNGDGFFENLSLPRQILQDAQVMPAFIDFPRVGSMEDSITGNSFSQVDMVQLNANGDSIALLGTTILDSVGRGIIGRLMPLIENINLQLRDRNIKLNSLVCKVEGTNSVGNLAEKIGLKVYPQPARDHLKVQFELSKREEVFVEIYGLDGKLAKKKKPTILNAGLASLSIELSSLPTGPYLLRIHNSQGIATQKILIK